MSKVINQKYMSFEEVVIESENEEDYKESLDIMRKAGFTRIKIYDNESMTMIPAKKILKNGHIVQRYKRFGGYEIIESKLRAELPKGVKPADRKEENK